MDVSTLAEALFASSLRPSDRPATHQVQAAIAATLRAIGVTGCVGVMAQEFGDHPESAVVRMRWALNTVRALQPVGIA